MTDRQPDNVVRWRTYVIALDDVCSAAGIPVAPGAEIEADFPDRTSLRVIVKEGNVDDD